MIYESYPWRKRLANIRKEIKKINTKENFESNDEETYSILEQDIFLSAFIVRKLIDCKSKVIDKLRDYTFTVNTYVPIKKVDFFHRWPEDDCFNLEDSTEKHVNEKVICNSLIHSYIFGISQEYKDGPADGFFVSSDKDRNKILYFVRQDQYLDFLDIAVNSKVTNQEARYNNKEQDYVFINK